MIQFTLAALLIQVITVSFPQTIVKTQSVSQLFHLLEDDIVPPRVLPLPASNDDDDVVPPRVVPQPLSNENDDVVPPR